MFSPPVNFDQGKENGASRDVSSNSSYGGVGMFLLVPDIYLSHER